MCCQMASRACCSHLRRQRTEASAAASEPSKLECRVQIHELVTVWQSAGQAMPPAVRRPRFDTETAYRNPKPPPRECRCPSQMVPVCPPNTRFVVDRRTHVATVHERAVVWHLLICCRDAARPRLRMHVKMQGAPSGVTAQWECSVRDPARLATIHWRSGQNGSVLGGPGQKSRCRRLLAFERSLSP